MTVFARRLWATIADVGVSRAMQRVDAKYVRLTNQGAAFLGLVWTGATLLPPPSRWTLLLSASGAVLTLLTFAWAAAGRHAAARLHLALASASVITALAIAHGPAADDHLGLVLVAMGQWLIYPPARWRVPAVLTLLLLSTFIGLEVAPREALVPLPAAVVASVRTWNHVALGIVALGFAYYHLRASAAFEATIESLLHSILPPSIANRLVAEERPIADAADATILFADIADFTPMSTRLGPRALVTLLDEVFTAFDALVAARGLEKVKTIGDAYMVAAGVPASRDDHGDAVLDLALAMLATVQDGRFEGVRLRIGVATGPVVAGVIGRQKFAYDLWGDAVNTAARMESHGVIGRVHVTDELRQLCEGRFTFEDRGEIDVKGKGRMRTWFLVGPRGI